MIPTHSAETGASQGEHTRRAHRIWLVLGVIASLIYLIMRMHTPIAVHAESIHDDQLFMAMGQRIADGHWLGAYNQLTLIKGPGYPLFLALNAWLGLPLSLSEALLQGLAIGIFFWVFARISRMPNVAMFGYIATLWMPAPYFERIMRDCIYPAQMLLVLAGLLATLYLDMPRKQRLACALAAGLVLGWFSLTREEGIWIAPGIAVIVLAAALHRRYKPQLKALVLMPLAVVIIGYTIPQLIFLSTNKLAYHAFTGVEITSSPYKDAMAALQSVQVGEPTPYVPVPKRAREAIYQVSPSFLMLKGYFDPPTGSPWQYGCHFYPETCGDIAGGWFMWALRDAVAMHGFYSSPKRAASFYSKLTDEVQTACRTGKLQCKPLPIGMLPRMTASQWAKLPASVLSGLQIITLYTPSLANIPSTGPAADLALDMEFLGSPMRSPAATDTATYSILGWYYGTGKKGWISGKVTSGDGVNASNIARLDSPDLVSGLKTRDAGQQRFSTTVSCQAPCTFSITDDSNATVDIQLAEAAGHPSSYPFNGATLNIDQINESSTSAIKMDPRYRVADSWRQVIEKAYGHILPWLLPLSLLAMFLTLLISFLRRSLTATTVLATAAWALLASRLLLLALVDISSFPGMIVPYLSPAYVLTCIVPILSFAALYKLATEFKQQSPSAAQAERPKIDHI